MSDNIEITIKDWIKLPETQALERHYKELGLIENDSSWDDFEIVSSVKSYETYEHVDTNTFKYSGFISAINKTYGLSSSANNADERILRCLSGIIYSLRFAAIGTKIEGEDIGVGRLIVQERMPITISDDLEKTGFRQIMWRGNILRIGERYELH